MTGTSSFAQWSGAGSATGRQAVLRYAIGGASSPLAGDGIEPVTEVSADTLSMTAIVRTNDPALSVVGFAAAHLDSADWSTNGVTMTPAAGQVGVPEGCQMQIFSTPRDTNAAKFLRLQSTLTNQ